MKYSAFILMIFVLFSCQQKSTSLFSPDENTKVDVWVDEISTLNYSVTFENELIIAPSFIGFELEDGTELGSDVKIISVSQTEANKSWQPVYGERLEIRDNYRELTLLLQENVDPKRKFEITFRLYNEGVAFKTTFLPSENASVRGCWKGSMSYSSVGALRPAAGLRLSFPPRIPDSSGQRVILSQRVWLPSTG